MNASHIRKKITLALIKVSMMEGKGADAMKPLVFAVFEALVPEDVLLRCYDERVADLPEKIDADIIALSVETFAAKHGYWLAKKYKTTRNQVIMGGFHPSALPQEALRCCDTVLMGDAEGTLPEYLADFRNGTPKKIYAADEYAPLAKISLNGPCFSGKKYKPIGLVQFSRGCRYRCDFCSIHAFYHGRVKQKNMDDVVDEIRSMKEKLVFFIDDNLFFDEKSALELCSRLRPLKKKWACQISLDVAQNDNLLRAMKDSGCILVLIGFESLNQDNLKIMHKAANLAAGSYEEAVANIHKHGLMIYATFALGYDYDTPQSIRDTLQFALSQNFATANFNPLIPFPKTALYERLEKQGRLTAEKWWLKDGYRYGDTAFAPASMTAEELAMGCKNARYAFHSLSSMWKRFLRGRVYHSPFNALVFFALNLISMKEIRRKQGKLLK